jgi:hypothetical protein
VFTILWPPSLHICFLVTTNSWVLASKTPLELIKGKVFLWSLHNLRVLLPTTKINLQMSMKRDQCFSKPQVFPQNIIFFNVITKGPISYSLKLCPLSLRLCYFIIIILFVHIFVSINHCQILVFGLLGSCQNFNPLRNLSLNFYLGTKSPSIILLLLM